MVDEILKLRKENEELRRKNEAIVKELESLKEKISASSHKFPDKIKKRSKPPSQ